MICQQITSSSIAADFPLGKKPSFRLEVVGEPQGRLQDLLEATVPDEDTVALFAEASIKSGTSED